VYKGVSFTILSDKKQSKGNNETKL